MLLRNVAPSQKICFHVQNAYPNVSTISSFMFGPTPTWTLSHRTKNILYDVLWLASESLEDCRKGEPALAYSLLQIQ